MKYQNFAIIFVLIILPISIVLSYYIQTQTDTLVLQTTYQTKLNDSTYDAISAYQMNSLNTQRVSGESVKSYVLASVNTFFTTLATNLGMSSASKQMVLPYVPAILFTTYDGYYIYSPTYTSKVATNPDDGVALTDKQKRVLYLKKGKKVDSSDFVSDGNNGKKFKEDYDSSKFTPNPDDTDVQYETSYMLKPFIYYSTQYSKGTKFDFTASYSLDNYVTLYGKKDLSTRTDSGSAVTEEFTKSGYLIDPTKISINGNLLLRVVKKNSGETGISMAQPSNNGTYSYQAVIDANKNSDNDQHNNERFVTIPVNVINGQSSQLEDYYLINYFDYEKEKDFGDGYYCAKYRKDSINSASRNQMSIVRYQTGDEIINETLAIEKMLETQNSDVNGYIIKSGYNAFSGITVMYNGVKIEDKDAKEYYLKAYYFSKWVQNNLSDVEAGAAVQLKDQSNNEFAYADFTDDTSKIFNIQNNADNNPESENSNFAKHKQDVIKNSIQYNLNLAISTYNENHNMDIESGVGYKLPVLKTEDWNDVLNNISMVAFMQGIPCGTTTFNNYSVIKSNNNNTSVSLENLYFTEKIGTTEKSDKSYHKLDCENLGNINSYNNIDVYEADQSAEFKYDAHKINTRIASITDQRIQCFYDDTNNKYYRAISTENGTVNTNSQYVDELSIGEEITDQNEIATLTSLPTGSGVKYLYDHQNEGCYSCIISGNYNPVIKYYNGDIYKVYKAENNDLIINVNGKYLNLDGSEYVNPINNSNTPDGGGYILNDAEFQKRRKSMYTYLAKIRNGLYKTNDYVNR